MEPVKKVDVTTQYRAADIVARLVSPKDKTDAERAASLRKVLLAAYAAKAKAGPLTPDQEDEVATLTNVRRIEPVARETAADEAPANFAWEVAQAGTTRPAARATSSFTVETIDRRLEALSGRDDAAAVEEVEFLRKLRARKFPGA